MVGTAFIFVLLIFAEQYTFNVEKIISIYDFLVDSYGFWGLVLMGIALALFCIQMYYYTRYYARIPKYRNVKRTSIKRDAKGISVIVLVCDNIWYLKNTLPKLLTQDYSDFEIVVVDVGSDEEFSNELSMIKDFHANLVTTKIEKDPRFRISNKMAYNVGIKAASYENIILTTADAAPVCEKWLSCMGKGFVNGEVVLGYCGVERKKGLANKMMRCSRLMMSVRYLAAAIKGRPYRGIIHNIGFSKDIYFRHKGFDHLDMNLGEDDLFIQRIANRENTSIVMNPHATVRQSQWGGLNWWWQQRKFFSAGYRYYPRRAKNSTEWELGSRLAFYIAVIAIAIIMPFEIRIAAGAIWLIRLLTVRFQMWRIRRRLNERGLGWAIIFYDIIAPLCELCLAISRKLRPAPGIWR